MTNCQNCNKARATVHLTEIDPDNSQPTEVHLCEDCAYESGASTQKMSTVAGPAALISIEPSAKGRNVRQVSCDECGMTYQEFRRVGRFGCCRCYEVFEEGLIPLLDKVHGATQYEGPVPGESTRSVRSIADTERELGELRRELKRLVKAEDYEGAARVRDRILNVERELVEGDDG